MSRPVDDLVAEAGAAAAYRQDAFVPDFDVGRLMARSVQRHSRGPKKPSRISRLHYSNVS